MAKDNVRAARTVWSRNIEIYIKELDEGKNPITNLPYSWHNVITKQMKEAGYEIEVYRRGRDGERILVTEEELPSLA